MTHMKPLDDLALAAAASALQRELAYKGPERRGGPSAGLIRVLACVLDEIDYGLILLDAKGWVVHANHGASRELSNVSMPLEVVDRHLRGRQLADNEMLQTALFTAQHQGKRSMLHLGEGNALGVSVVPLPAALSRGPDTEGHATLVLLQRSSIVERLSIDAYARQHNLSHRETQVLGLLCNGRKAAEIAEELKVSLATVRTHIHNLKDKTGCGSMLDVVKQVAVLPPIVHMLDRARG